MSNQLKPVLCESESETNTIQSETETPDTQIKHQKIFRQADASFIPDFSDQQTISSVEIKTPSDNIQYHCITTHGDKEQNNPIYQPETIENIIRKLDVREESIVTNTSDENKEYITKSKFSTLIGEMRVDILSMINLLSMLNKNATSSNDEIQSIKRDICSLVSENNKLKDKIKKIRDDADTRILDMSNKIDELTTRLDTGHNSTSDIKVIRKIRPSSSITAETNPQDTDLVTNRQMSRQAIRIAATQALNQTVTQEPVKITTKTSPIRTTRQVKDRESDEESSESDEEPEQIPKKKSASNSITDSNMDKNIAKFKVVPTRSKKNGSDNFGVIEKLSDDPVFTGNFRVVARRDNLENNAKIMSDTKTSRANRLGLFADKLNVRRR
jgi:hypothetical protein